MIEYVPYAVAAVALVLVAVTYKLWLRLLGAVIVPDDSIAIVNKKFVLFGSNKNLPDGCIVALNGEAGIQADTLPPGVHWGFWPWQYEINVQKFTMIPQGQLGMIAANDGTPLTQGRVLAKHIDCESFQNARKFLTQGGERGTQISVIPPGTYRINTALFNVKLVNITEIPDNKVGIVTTKEGKPLATGNIAGAEIEGHNLFQDAQGFLTAGGFKGLQEQVILAGRYFINPAFASIEVIDMTLVPIANVGVVISYVGAMGQDVSGDSFKHGNLVERGQKGVWVRPLEPGKYPINTFTHRVENVPTANVVLNWATGKTEAHNLDKNLSTITVRSSDGFTFNLDVSQIIHIPHTEAPKVIARFGNMQNLVTQVLEPTIGNYFRNAAQSSDAIDFLKTRAERQNAAKAAITKALEDYNVVAVDTLIGDITPPEALMKTLTDRKIAEQQKITFDTQQLAETTRKELEQARAVANTQAKVVDAERSVSIARFNAEAAIAFAEGEAKSKTINAEADASVTRLTGDAEAAKVLAIGTAESTVIEKKIDSMESGNYAAIQIAQALSTGKMAIVPEIMVSGNGDGGNGSGILNVLMARMLQRQDDDTPSGSKH